MTIENNKCMFIKKNLSSLLRLSALLLLFAGFVSGAYSQTKAILIRGVVSTRAGKPVVDANVYLTYHGESNALEASFTDERGTFMIVSHPDRDSVDLHISKIGILPYTVRIKNESQLLKITVEEKDIELPEVEVHNEKMYSEGDTINYVVSAFKGKNDITLNDVLQKLPGISVSAGGQISANGQPIKHLYIEGEDLMNGKYGIATANIDPDNISLVQVYQNYQDIHALKGLKPQEKASINLKLKKGAKGVLSLIGTLGGGYDNAARWNNQLIASYFRQKSQYFATYKGNNTGEDLQYEYEPFYNPNYSYTYDVTDISMPSSPSIPKKYYYFNRTNSASLSNIYALGKATTIGFNVDWLNDEDSRNSIGTTRNFLPGGEVNKYTESMLFKMKSNRANGLVMYESNQDKYYLKEQVSLSYATDKGTTHAILDNDKIDQNNKIDNYRVQNKFHLINRTGKSGYEITSFINVEKRPHNLMVAPNLFEDLLTGQNMYQSADRKNFITSNSIGLLQALTIGNFQLAPSLQIEYDHNSLSSDIEKFRNNLDLNTLITGVALEGIYSHKGFHANIQLNTNYRYYGYDNKIDNETKKKHNFFVEPDISMWYNIKGGHQIRYRGNMYYSDPAIENLFVNNILTGYRQISAYTFERFYIPKRMNNSIAYNNMNIKAMRFWGVTMTWNRLYPEVLYGASYKGNIETVTSVETNSYSDQLTANARFSQGFDWKQLNIGVSAQYSHAKNPLLIQNQETFFKRDILAANLNVYMSPANWCNISYDASLQQTKTKMDIGAKMPKITTIENRASIELLLPKNISLTAGAYNYYNNMNKGDKSFWLADLNAKYTIGRFTFDLALDNLFNRKTYVQVKSSRTTEQMMSYQIRPLSILLKVRLRLL